MTERPLYPSSDTMLDRLLRTDHKAVDKTEPVSKILGWLREETRNPPVILDGKRPYGIPNKTACMGSRILDNAAVAKYTKPTPLLHTNTSILQAMVAVSESLSAYLPVAKENDTLAGYVRAIDLAKEVEPGLDAAAMAHRVSVLSPTDNIGRAIVVFRENHTDHLPVIDDDGRLVGTLPRRNVIDLEVDRTQSYHSGDRAPDTQHMQKSSVSDWMEVGAIELPTNAGYDRVVQTLSETGYAMVTNTGGTGQVDIHGVLLPEYVVRAAYPHHDAPQPGSTHGAGRPSRR